MTGIALCDSPKDRAPDSSTIRPSQNDVKDLSASVALILEDPAGWTLVEVLVAGEEEPLSLGVLRPYFHGSRSQVRNDPAGGAVIFATAESEMGQRNR